MIWITKLLGGCNGFVQSLGMSWCFTQTVDYFRHFWCGVTVWRIIERKNCISLKRSRQEHFKFSEKTYSNVLRSPLKPIGNKLLFTCIIFDLKYGFTSKRNSILEAGCCGWGWYLIAVLLLTAGFSMLPKFNVLRCADEQINIEIERKKMFNKN